MAGWAGAAVGAAGMAAAAQGGAEGAAERCVRSLTHQSSPCLPFTSHRPQIGASCPTFLLLHCREQALLRAAGRHSRLCAIHRKQSCCSPVNVTFKVATSWPLQRELLLQPWATVVHLLLCSRFDGAADALALLALRASCQAHQSTA